MQIFGNLKAGLNDMATAHVPTAKTHHNGDNAPIVQSAKALRCVEIFSAHSAKGTSKKDTTPVAVRCVELSNADTAQRKAKKDTTPVAVRCVERPDANTAQRKANMDTTLVANRCALTIEELVRRCNVRKTVVPARPKRNRNPLKK